MASGVAPALKARRTSSSKTRLWPTRNTPGGSSRSGTATVSGSKSSVVIGSTPSGNGTAPLYRPQAHPDAPQSTSGVGAVKGPDPSSQGPGPVVVGTASVAAGYSTLSAKLCEWLLNSGAYMHWISAIPV